MNQYSIHEDNIERLEKKLNRIFNKCQKYGCEFSYSKVGEEFKELKDENGKVHVARFIIVEADGKAVVNGWKFLASIQHTQNGNIISGIGKIEVPERFYNSDPVCEHCNSKRIRKDTYIIMNEESGEFKQVGKSCLNDFTNGLSAEAVAYYISFFDELIQAEAPGSCRGENYYNTETLLLYVSETIKHFGFVSTQAEREESTASRSFDFYCIDYNCHYMDKVVKHKLIKQMEMVGFNVNSEDNVSNVKNALAWIRTQEETNNYIHNLKTVCSLEYVTRKNLGILASLFPAYDKNLRYQAKKKEQEIEKSKELDSKHVGEIGQRITIKVQSIACLTSWETQWGICGLYKIVDENGNVYIWKTSNYLELDEIKTISATVKEHKEFNDIKQTEITRCRVVN